MASIPRRPTVRTSKSVPSPSPASPRLASSLAKVPMAPQAVAAQCVCVVGGAIDIIGKKWTLCIVVTVGNRPGIRFNELMADLGGISPRTLSETLKALESEGIVERTAFRETPPRVEYRLTPDGARLRLAVVPLMEWAAGRPGAVCQPEPKFGKR